MTLDDAAAIPYDAAVMNAKFIPLILLTACVFHAGAPAARALDGGAQHVAGDIDGRVTFEVQYERYERDIRQDIAFIDDQFSGQQQEDRTRVYIHFFPATNLTLRLDTGIVASEDATRVVPLVGGLATYRLGEWGNARLTMSAGGYYVDEIVYERSGALTPLVEIASIRRTESYYEFGGTLNLSYAWLAHPACTLRPYAVIGASWLEADGTEVFRLESSGRERTDDSVGFRQESPITLAAGVTATVHRNYGARLEARFLDTATYSASVFFSF